MEPAQRLEAGPESFGLVLRTDESLGQPSRTEGRLKIGEAGLVPFAFAAQVILHRFVQREPVDHRRRRQHGDLQHVLEAIEQRAAPVVVDVAVRDGEDVVRPERRKRRVGFLRRDLKPLELLVRR